MDNIKKFRGEIGMTQKDLAEAIDVTRSLVISLEKDSCHSTSRATTKKLCDLFKVSPCKLYGIDNLRYKPESKQDLEELISVLTEELKKWD